MQIGIYELIKNRNHLYTTGSGIILFTLWDALRIILFCFLNTKELFVGFDLGDDPLLVERVTVVIVLLFTAVFTYLHIYIGKSAQNSAKGLHQGKAYVVISAILLVISAFSIVYGAGDVFAEPKISTIVETLIEITEAMLYAELIFYSIKVRKHKEAR